MTTKKQSRVKTLPPPTYDGRSNY